MNAQLASIAALSDSRLLAQVTHLAQHEREATAKLIAHLAVLDERRLYLGEGCSSLFAYCTRVLHLSEGAAYGRIQAARVARRFPVVLDNLAGGALNLTNLGLLAPHLTEANHVELLAAAQHKSKHEVEELVAPLRPLSNARASIRRLPPARPVVRLQAPASTALPCVPPAAAPMQQHAPLEAQAPSATLVPQRTPAPAQAPALAYRIQFTASAQTHAKLRRAQELLRHQIPDGDPAAVIDRALGVLIAHLEKSKVGKVDRPRPTAARDDRLGGVARGAGLGRAAAPGVTSSSAASNSKPTSRHIPAAVRRAVWQRDDGRCAFIGRDDRRCDERGFVEFHHVKPFAAGGEASVKNIELRCRAHNQYEAVLYFSGGPVSRPSQIRESVGVYNAAARCARGGKSAGRELGLDPVNRHVDFWPHEVRPKLGEAPRRPVTLSGGVGVGIGPKVCFVVRTDRGFVTTKHEAMSSARSTRQSRRGVG